jgi:hypothetical protein
MPATCLLRNLSWNNATRHPERKSRERPDLYGNLNRIPRLSLGMTQNQRERVVILRTIACLAIALRKRGRNPEARPLRFRGGILRPSLGMKGGSAAGGQTSGFFAIARMASSAIGPTSWCRNFRPLRRSVAASRSATRKSFPFFQIVAPTL